MTFRLLDGQLILLQVPFKALTNGLLSLLQLPFKALTNGLLSLLRGSGYKATKSWDVFAPL